MTDTDERIAHDTPVSGDTTASERNTTPGHPPGASLSVLFPSGSRSPNSELRQQPAYFADLNLDQFVESVTATFKEYDLAPFFSEHLEELDVISYRQEIFEDLEERTTFDHVSTFAKQLRDLRILAEETSKLRVRYQQEGAFIDIVERYTGAIQELEAALRASELHARGMCWLRDYLTEYVTSATFGALVADSKRIRERLAEVHYEIRIRGLRVIVAKYEEEADYSAEVLQTFDRFKQWAAKDYRVGFRTPFEINHIEANVLNLVARLYPEIFAELDQYCARHRDYFDDAVRRFDREVEFYVSYLEYVAPLRALGLTFCYPEVTRESKEVFANETFDLVLASKLRAEEEVVVTNDISLVEPERIVVVSGPNQGGKTTFARTFGQLHHLATLGCPVPGQCARLFLFDQLFTQFEREEDLSNMTGKLEDDLLRVRDILGRATPESIVVFNEIFASTTLQDSIFLSTNVMERLVELDLLAVFVTFIEELASFGPTTLSMVSTVVPENLAERTFKVVRKPADGLAYALALAEKYGLTYGRLKQRLSS